MKLPDFYSWRRDVRSSLRSLTKAPGFSFTVLLTLALCMGPTAGVFTLLYSVALKPLPFPKSISLFVVSNIATNSGGAVSQSGEAQYKDFAAHADLFAGLALTQHGNATIDEDNAPIRAYGLSVSPGFFEVIDVSPLRGRFFSSDEDLPGRSNVLVLTEQFWRTHYIADNRVIGRSVRLGGETFTIIGVAPDTLKALYPRMDFFRPLVQRRRDTMERRFGSRAVLIGRLKPRVSAASATMQLNAIEQRYYDSDATPEERRYWSAGGYRIALTSLRSDISLSVLKSLWFLQAAGGVALAIGAVNITNLFLARALSKRRELLIRYSLGAGRLELFRQIAVESMLLTMTAGVISCGLAAVLVEISRVYLPAAIGPAASAIAIDYRVIKVVLLSSIALGMLVALIPFLSVLSTLHKEGIQVGIKSGFAKVTDIALAPAQLAISVVLLVCAFLMYKSFQSILAVPPGFDPAHLVQARIALPATYTAPGPSTSMRNRVLTAVRSIPGVERAAAVSNFGVGPASSFPTQTFVLKRDVAVPHNPEVIVDYVSPEFFETMRIALISGRFFSESDDARAEGFLIVDDAFVRRYFPGRDPLGEEIALASSRSSPDLRWATIIGVVRRANLTGLEGRDGLPFVFCPLGSRSTPGFNIVLRSSRPKDEVIADIRAKLRSVDSTLPLYSEGTVQGAIAGLLMPRRVAIALLTVFCLLAVSLAGIGVFGVLSYNVSQRTKEIGIRIAIGASPLKVVYLIVGHGLYRAGVGIGTGLLCSLFLVRYTRSMLFDTAPTDASAFALVPLILFAIVLLACWHPARKAVNTDPMVALRSE